MTPHNEAKMGEIAETVLMPGDPLRAKYIVDNYMTNVKLVNSVRNMYGYTGEYKGKRISVFASGMGMPSMGIYCYELYKFYGVNNIIRIGSCGSFVPELDLLDTILIDKSYTEGNFAFALDSQNIHTIESSKELNDIIKKTANENNIKIANGNVACSEVFDYYVKSLPELLARYPKDLHIIASEMEAFALFYTAKYLNKDASCLLTVVDSHYKKGELSAQDREKSLNNMIELALESAIKIKD